MEQSEKLMKIAELSERTGVSSSTIKYYIRTKVLPKPIRVNKTTGLYTETHVKIIEFIKEIRNNKKLPITYIKKIMDLTNKDKLLNGKIDELSGNQILKNEIVDCSISIFRKKGYEKATITDITKAAKVSRSTFYRYFRDKKELFTECFNKILFDYDKKTPASDKHFFTIMEKRLSTWLDIFPQWSDMMNLLRAMASKYPDEFADKLEEATNSRVRIIANELENSIRRGEMREVDIELVSAIIAGASEYVFYYLSRGKFKHKDQPEVLKEYRDLFAKALEKPQ